MTIRPNRDLVARIAREEAAQHGVDLTEVLEMSKARNAKAARIQAFKRIAAETGAGPGAIASVWGCTEAAVAYALGQRPSYVAAPQGPGQGRDATVERLTWQYGPERAAAIVAGRDLATQQDLAAWRRIGGAA